MNDLVKVEAKDFGLEEKSVKAIEVAFTPKILERDELNKVYEVLITKELTPELCSEAKTLRNKLVKVRTGIAEVHKTQKAFFLASGKFVDAWKNKETLPVTQMEEKLLSVEKHFENIEKEKREKVHALRVKELEKYGVENIPPALGAMNDEIFNNYLIGVKTNFEAQIEAERKAEADRVEAERKLALNQKRLNQTSRLMDYIDDYDKIAFADMSDEDYKVLCETAIAKRTAYEKEQEAIRLDNERLKNEAIEKEKEAEKERIRLEKIAEQERAESEAKIKAEREAREKLEAKIQEGKDAETKRLQEEVEAKEAEASKGDKEKYADFRIELSILADKYAFKSKKYQEAYKKDVEVLNRIIRGE